MDLMKKFSNIFVREFRKSIAETEALLQGAAKELPKKPSYKWHNKL